MYLKYVAYVAIVTAVSLMYYKYTDMVDTIESQKQEIKNKDLVIGIQAGNIEVMKEKFQDDIARKVFEATAKQKKKELEGGLTKDDKTSVDIKSTRIYF